MSVIEIGRYRVGQGQEPFIIGEVGINHNGDVERALAMIDAGREAGCTSVKFQTFKAEELVLDPTVTYTYKSQGEEITEAQIDMFRRYELDEADFRRLKQRCEERGLVFLSTPQNRSDLDILLRIGVEAVKVGSDDFSNIPLLKSYAETKLPLLLSCGMADMADVHQALAAVGAFDGYPVVLLYCVSLYPTPPDEVNLNRLATLRRAFPDIVLGFSDHTAGPLASSLAVTMGACLFEKHFTLDHDLPGPDHWFSEEPADLKAWADGIRTAHRMMGSGIVRPTARETEMRAIARRSIVALKDVAAGEELTLVNTGLRRPGTGIAPVLLDKVLGKRASRALKRGQLLEFGDFT
ncbi:MAG TPA: N-acetylneuraminate synthase family protein [Magnetospirillaceae bacterium]|nr:N-acetylneuraminate synthase family protein [Magnetospirillaceae bacterium]